MYTTWKHGVVKRSLNWENFLNWFWWFTNAFYLVLSRYANSKKGLKFKLRFQESMICPLLAFVPKISMWGVLSNVHKKDAYRFHLSNIVRCGIERLSNNKKVPGFLMCLPQLRCKWICAFHFNSPMNIRSFSNFISC